MKKLRLLIVLFLSLGGSLLSGCKDKVCMMPMPAVDNFFVIKRNNAILKSDSFLSKITLFYFDNYGKRVERPGPNLDDTSFIYLADQYYKGDSEFKGSGIMFMRYLAGISVDDKINNFFIQFPDGDIDTRYYLPKGGPGFLRARMEGTMPMHFTGSRDKV